MVNLKNEINIRIDNSNKNPKKKHAKRKPRLTEEEKEDLAMQQLDNLYYDNHALMTQHQQGQSRGSGGSIILPPSTSDTNKNSYFHSSENNPNSNPNLSGNFFNSLYKSLQNSSSSTIASELNKPSSNYNPSTQNPKTITNATVKVLNPKGRPRGAYGKYKKAPKEKLNEPNAPSEEVTFVSQEQSNQPTQSMFDNPDNQPIITEPDEPQKPKQIITEMRTVKRLKKTSEIGKKDKQKEIKGTVLRPDKNEL